MEELYVYPILENTNHCLVRAGKAKSNLQYKKINLLEVKMVVH